MQLSIFKGWTDATPTPTTLEALVEMMRTDASLKSLTEKHRYYRSIGDAEEAKYHKRRMPCFSVAVRFVGGKQKRHIAAWTGLTIVDIDHIAPSDMERVLHVVRDAPHTLLAYTTISGEGVRVIVAVDYGCESNEERLTIARKACTKGGAAATKGTLCVHDDEDTLSVYEDSQRLCDNEDENRSAAPHSPLTTHRSPLTATTWVELTKNIKNSLHCRFCLDTGLRLHENDLYVII